MTIRGHIGIFTKPTGLVWIILSFDLPAMPVHRFRIVPYAMLVIVLLCLALNNFAWQAGIRICFEFQISIFGFGLNMIFRSGIRYVAELYPVLTFDKKTGKR